LHSSAPLNPPTTQPSTKATRQHHASKNSKAGFNDAKVLVLSAPSGKRFSQPAGASASSERRREKGGAAENVKSRLGSAATKIRPKKEKKQLPRRLQRLLFFLRDQTGGGARPLRCRLLRFGDGSVKTKEAFDPCDFESVVDALIHGHQAEAASIFLPRDIGSDERSNPRRIRERDIGKVQNERPRVVGTHLGLKAE
jgi:hypothetical protein